MHSIGGRNAPDCFSAAERESALHASGLTSRHCQTSMPVMLSAVDDVITRHSAGISASDLAYI